MVQDKRKRPLDPRAGSPSENSRLRAATDIQSPVTPEDYPVKKREGQTAVVGKRSSGESTGKEKARK